MRVSLPTSIVFVTIGLTYFSCTKDKGLIATSELVKVNSAVCYPYDSCVVNFSLDTRGMTPPIKVTWLEPSYLVGDNNLVVLLEADQLLKARVEDAKSNSILLNTVLRKTDFDSLVYDYRLPILGKYKGFSQSSWVHYDGVNYVLTYGPLIADELEVVKDQNYFGAIKLNGFGIEGSSLSYNFHLSTFQGHRMNGLFRTDSISITYQPTLAPNWQSFRGKHSN